MSGATIVFGGTFDPVHNGHLSIVQQAQERTSAAAVWFVLTNVPPLRDPASAPAPDRFAMLQAAIAGHDDWMALDIELRRDETSYTAETMDELHSRNPDTAFVLLLGVDVARTIRSWHRFADLLARERFLIVNRTGTQPMDDAQVAALGYPPERTLRLEVDSPAISATGIRSRIARGEAVDDLVPQPVAGIIKQRGLYLNARPVHNGAG